jgi:hypothetical protein
MNLKPLHPLSHLFLIALFLSACSVFQTADSTSIPPLITTPAPEKAWQTLAAVTQATAPARDMVALAAQLRGIEAPRVAQTEPTPYQMRQIETFWVQDIGTDENYQLEARLVYQSDTLQMWVDLEESIHVGDLQAAATTIEQQILPTDRAFFGTEWQPGVDGDNRVVILHVADVGGAASAYFSAADEVVTAVNPFSNQREMLTISLDDLRLGSEEYYAAVAHELQHLIQWHTDPNEAAWLNEGLAELAGYVNGYEIGRQQDYADRTDTQLTNLSQQPDVIAYHYAAASLFTVYFLDRFGEEMTQALVQNPANSIAGFTGLGVDFDAVFADWLVANYLAGVGRGEGVFDYATLEIEALKPQSIWRFPASETTAVSQYGADFYRISSDEPVTVAFTGSTQVLLNGAAPHKGSTYYATIPADNSNMSLTRAFDLRGLDRATLTFWTWYDIEEGWDYGYVAVSTDAGQSWQLLETQSTTLDNPQGNSFGAGYTGKSGGGAEAVWVQETADLTPYINQEILLRFQYITDLAVHEAGFVIDDIAIPELDYADDAERDGGWQEAGFVRSGHILPQTFIVQRILLSDDEVRVERLPLDENQWGQWYFPMDKKFDEAILIVAGNTAVTRETAVYQYEITHEN